MTAMIKTRRMYVNGNDGYGGVGNPLALLVLRIIQRAQLDVMMGPRRGKHDYWSAVVFFESELYGLMLDYLSAVMADFEPGEGLLPWGVEGKDEGGRQKVEGRMVVNLNCEV